MAKKLLKSVINNLATPFLSNIVSNFASNSSKDAGKVAATLLSKSPFEIKDSQQESLKRNPLTFESVQYPLDLGTEELGHYIVFNSGFINYNPQDRNTPFSQSAREADTVDKAKANISTAVGKKIGDLFNLNAGDLATIRQPSGYHNTTAIALYMPPDVKVKYGQTYTAEDAALFGDIEQGMRGVADAETGGEQMKAALVGAGGPLIRYGKKALGEFASIAGMGDPMRLVAKRYNMAINNRSEQFYDGPVYRKFSYDFDFWPRNEKESLAVEQICTIFKYNSSPGLKDKFGAIFEIPNYWQIRYYHKTEENENLHKIGACYCENVSIDYSPEEELSFFGNGKPTHTKLSVSFVEDRMLTKNDIVDGA
jgi:hypothetical protein|tara:strand:- start:11583 stop:12683 length:1101 start_codon:yes stop_codon:yes gene_type:complete